MPTRTPGRRLPVGNWATSGHSDLPEYGAITGTRRTATHHAGVDLTGGRVTVYVIGPWPPGGSARRLTHAVRAIPSSGPNP